VGFPSPEGERSLDAARGVLRILVRFGGDAHRRMGFRFVEAPFWRAGKAAVAAAHATAPERQAPIIAQASVASPAEAGPCGSRCASHTRCPRAEPLHWRKADMPRYHRPNACRSERASRPHEEPR